MNSIRTLQPACVVIALLSVTGCDRNTAEDPPPVATSSTPTVEAPANTTGGARANPVELPPGVTDSSGVERHDELVVGKPRQHWLDTFGPSDSNDQYFVKDGLLEYQVELHNVFRPDDPQTQKVEIAEDTWDGEGYTFVLWSFRRSAEESWQAVQAMSYEDGIEF